MTTTSKYRNSEVGYRTGIVLPAGVLLAMGMLLVAGNLAGNGALGSIVAQQALPGWEEGSLLRTLAFSLADALGPSLDVQTALVFISIFVATLGAAISYRMLRANDWPAWQALAVIGLIAGQGMMLFAITAATPHFMLVLAAGALIPASRRLEATGDVQAILNFALTLPLLLLAGPPLAVLLPLLLLLVPFREIEARQNPRIFGAMLLVAAIPTVITIVGVAVIAVRTQIGVDTIISPFATLFRPGQRPLVPAVLLTIATAPVMIALLVHMVVPDRRRQILTTVAALLIPAYLAVGNAIFFDWDFPDWLPATAMLGTVLGWLSSTRVRPWLRLTVIVLLLGGLIASWALTPIWAAQEWTDGLLPIQLFGYELG